MKVLNESQRRSVFQRDDYTCRFCGHRGNAASLKVDHSVPVSRRGTDHGNNLQTTCWVCNNLKDQSTTRAFETWLQRTFASRSHYARYAAACRRGGYVLDLGRWLAGNSPMVFESLFRDWSVPAAHRRGTVFL
jgi:hypothetical protein